MKGNIPIISQASEDEVRAWCKSHGWLLVMETKARSVDYILSYLTPTGESIAFYIQKGAVYDVE